MVLFYAVYRLIPSIEREFNPLYSQTLRLTSIMKPKDKSSPYTNPSDKPGHI